MRQLIRLNPPALSNILGKQLFCDYFFLKDPFVQNLLPLVRDRLLDQSLQRQGSGSISLGSAASLYLISYVVRPKVIIEVGTYIGCSAAAIGYGAKLSGSSFTLFTCDINPCTAYPLEGLNISPDSQSQVYRSSSTEMFVDLAEKGIYADILHLDGRLMAEDFDYLPKLITSETIIILDDCENGEKGHANLTLLRNSGLVNDYAFIEPFQTEVFESWGLSTRSTTGVLIPARGIQITRQ